MEKPAVPCADCPLHLVGTGYVRGDGPLTAPLLIVGEAPGATEAKQGTPFVGAAGRMLDRLFRRVGADRAVYRVANALCCQPPRNYLAGAPYEHTALKACEPFLDEEIARVNPRVILALGNIAMRRLVNQTGITRYRGFPIRHPSGAWVLPTYHPSHLLPRKGQQETAKLTALVALDLKRALTIAAEGFIPAGARYLCDPSPSAAAIFAVEYENAAMRGTARYLSWDIETPGKLKQSDEEGMDEESFSTQILRISFSFTPGYAVSMRWSPEYLPTIRRILSLPGVPHVVWNGYAFDLPILELNGITVANDVYDGMWGWHLLQSDLPRGLETVTSIYAPELGPWKHLADAEPARYNAQDADAALRCMLGIEADLKGRGQWDLYLQHIVRLWPFLFEAGRRHGVPIDIEAQNDLKRQLTADRDRLLRAAQHAVHDSLKRAKVWKKRPPEGVPVTEVLTTKPLKVCSACSKTGINRLHILRHCPTGEILTREVATVGYRWAPDWDSLSGLPLVEAVEVAGFNPLSSQQLIAYARRHAHPVGIDYKTDRAQFDKKVRTRLIRKYGDKHPIYAISQELQELSKTLGTYVEGFTPDSAGRIYTVYTFAPSTGRLSSRNVNLQNVSRNSNNRWAPHVRRTITAGPGHVFVEGDSAAIEAVMTGFFMGDPEYIELAKLGVHDYVTCFERTLPFAREAIRDYRKDPEYEEARERNKRVVHGTNYGMTPRMMVMQYPGTFPSEREAAHAQARYFEACPRLGPWQHEIRTLAHRQTYLQNPWGYRHYFYQVFDYEAEGVLALGPDAKRVVAFLPQSAAAAFMRDSLLLVAASPWAAYAPANISIHDSICLRVPEDQADEAVAFLAQLLTRPIPELNDLQIGCEIKMGPNWAEMKGVRRDYV